MLRIHSRCKASAFFLRTAAAAAYAPSPASDPQAGEGVVSIPEEVRGSEEVAREKFKFLLSPAAWPRPLKAPSPACGGRVGVGELAVETTPQPFTSSNSTSNISVAFGGMAPPAPRAP